VDNADTAAASTGLAAYLAEADKTAKQGLGTPAWVPVCTCGHPVSSHPAEQGGTLVSPVALLLLEGCVGPGRGRRPFGRVLDAEQQTMVRSATCPCREHRAVVEFDRPRQVIFHSAIGVQHPLAVALRGFRTQVHNKTGLEGDELVSAVDARFRWIEGTRRCAVDGCRNVDDVWPRFVSETHDSELLCEEHKEGTEGGER
jgi:hypothetical protein